MYAGMTAQIDEVGCGTDRTKSRPDNRLRGSTESQDGSMVVWIHRVVQIHDVGRRGHRVKYGLNGGSIPAFTEVRHTFNDVIHAICLSSNEKAGGLGLVLPASVLVDLEKGRVYFVFLTKAL
jgi:hypothetical protein